jgi:hypothetical protein
LSLHINEPNNQVRRQLIVVDDEGKISLGKVCKSHPIECLVR